MVIVNKSLVCSVKRPSNCYGVKHFITGEVENFADPFEGCDSSLGAIAISFYSGFWAYSGW